MRHLLCRPGLTLTIAYRWGHLLTPGRRKRSAKNSRKRASKPLSNTDGATLLFRLALGHRQRGSSFARLPQNAVLLAGVVCACPAHSPGHFEKVASPTSICGRVYRRPCLFQHQLLLDLRRSAKPRKHFAASGDRRARRDGSRAGLLFWIVRGRPLLDGTALPEPAASSGRQRCGGSPAVNSPG